MTPSSKLLLVGLAVAAASGCAQVPVSQTHVTSIETTVVQTETPAALPAVATTTTAIVTVTPLIETTTPGATSPMPVAVQPTSTGTIPTASIAPIQPPEVKPRIIRGNDLVIAPANSKGQITGTAAGLKLEDAPLSDVVSLILREIAKVDYVIHPPINGTVTLATQGDVTADHAVLLLEAALQANGLQMARDTRGVYHIGRPDALKGIVPALRQSSGNGPLPPGYGAVVIPLKYIGAGEMASILRPMAPPEAMVRVDTVRNLLVLVGTRTQAEGWLDIVTTFDVDLLQGMSVGVFPLKYVTTQEVEAALRLFNSGGSTASTPASTASAAGGLGAKSTSDASSSSGLSASFPLYGALRILPMERINSVIVVTPRAAYLDEARRWIEKLDQPGGTSAEAQLFMYPVQNGSAKHLADVLNGLFGGTSSSASSTPASSGVAPGLQQTTATTPGFSTTPSTTSSQTSTAKSQQASAGVTALKLNGGLRVIADELNNVVLVFGTKAEYETIESTLKRLDIPPTQVLIEASIVEVTLSDDLQYGLQWAFTDKSRGGLSGSGLLSTAANAVGGTVFGSTPAGFSYTLSNSLGDVRAVLNALATKSLVKVISSPTLMVMDNNTASIVVGTQQPISSGTTVTSVSTTSSIVYKDTGVSLTVTPSVTSGNMVTMQINQAVTDVGELDSATGQRAFLQRQFTSRVAVRSGESLVLGGLIRDNTTTGKNGLPVLQDLPIIGALFGTNTKNTDRTELLVVITPKVVRTEIDIRKVGQELKNSMKGIFPPPNPEPSPATFKPNSIHR